MLADGKRRARTEDERQFRKLALMNEAGRALESSAFEDVTMTDIARAVGITKGAAYHYFPTKEALFLALLVDELGQWFDRLGVGLKSNDKQGPEFLANLITSELLQSERLLKLLGLLHGQLEHNLPVKDLHAFKVFLRDRVLWHGEQIDQALHRKGVGATILLRAHALAIGVGLMADPPAELREILTLDPSLSAFCIQFKPMFEGSLADMIRGQIERKANP